MVRCSRRPTRDRRHAVRRGDFSLLSLLVHEVLDACGYGLGIRSFPFHSCWRDKSDIPAGADAFARARRQRRSRSVIAAREAGRLDGRVIVRATVTRLEPGGLLTICLCSECEARRMCPVPQGFVVRQQPVCCVSCAPVVLRPGHFICDLRIRCVENRNPSLRYGMWFATGVLAPALSEPKARSRAPARRLCDGVRRSRPTPCRQPEHRSHQTRSAAAASFARCIIEDSYYRQSGGAGSGG
jgi:hypothetical protein